jgi:hypothetical protein
MSSGNWRLAEHPSAIDAQLRLGRALLALGRTAEAERELAAGSVRARHQLSGSDPRLPQFEHALAAATRRANQSRASSPSSS